MDWCIFISTNIIVYNKYYWSFRVGKICFVVIIYFTLFKKITLPIFMRFENAIAKKEKTFPVDIMYTAFL